MASTDPLYPDISLYGAPGVGKTTALAFMERLGFTRVSFAGYHRGGLRDIALRLWGTGADNDRPLLNKLGMGMREIDEAVWVRAAEREIDRIHGQHGTVVMDDMRGDNEWKTLKGRGFVMVHMTAPTALREDRLRRVGKLEGSRPHELPFLYVLEDAGLYPPDHEVINESTEDELFRQIIDILNLERSKRA